MPVIRERFQQVGDGFLNRADHVWMRLKVQNRPGWKCVLCGAVTKKTPPVHPTGEGWTPEVYEPLTDEERKQCEYVEVRIHK